LDRARYDSEYINSRLTSKCLAFFNYASGFQTRFCENWKLVRRNIFRLCRRQ